MSEKAKKQSFKLEIPLDASTIEDFKPEKGVKVLLIDQKDLNVSQSVKLNKAGKGKAIFSFEKKPETLRVIVGPEDAEDEEMLGMQTISLDLPSRDLIPRDKLLLKPIQITPYFWNKWLYWCRTFTITGRVVCPDGKPVAGAKVYAKDVNLFWWWSNIRQVGSATTDFSGSFQIKFRWCCGWWPYWWWAQRTWKLEPALVDTILPEIEKFPAITRIPDPDPTPDLSLLREMIEPDQLPVAPALNRSTASILSTLPKQQRDQMLNFNVSSLESLGSQLRVNLPQIASINQLRLWPWHPWHPWWDCSPDIIFEVSQNCLGVEKTIVDETIWNTRWNISTNYNVTLVANNEACCIENEPQPEGNCINLTRVCDDPLFHIGGNLGATATPVGYRNPQLKSIYGDRPYAGNISLHGDFGTTSGADYYEIEWKRPTETIWNPMPPGAFAGFNRGFYGPQLPGGPIDHWTVPFPVQTIDGREVIETRHHFQANNGAGTWEILIPGSRWWNHKKTFLGTWRTKDLFTDGTYELRVKTWELRNRKLVNPQILDHCGAEPGTTNNIKITLDNRFVGSGMTSHRGHPCGPGTVHTCTTEPDTAILEVSILHADGTISKVLPCGEEKIENSDKLIIDFVAHDPDGHLSYYSLKTTYGNSQVRNLLNLPGASLSPSPLAPIWAPGTSIVGPRYSSFNPAISATDQGAIIPHWYGGAIRLEVNASDAFPESCCYQLELRAHKRTIVNCNESLWGHTNYTEYSFMIRV